MRKTATFNCSQQELYLVSEMAWGLCRVHLPRFTRQFGFYTEGYLDDRLAEVAAARAIPSHTSRKDAPTSNHVYLEDAIKDCGYCFQILKLLIKKTFEGDLQKVKLKAAGQQLFAKSMSGNQAKLNDLNETALRFLENNAADLMADNNMNPLFVDEYKAVVARYDALRLTYNDSKLIAQNLASENTLANKNVHKNMMDMLKDAKVVFRRERDIRCLFVFDTLLKKVRGK